MVTIFIFDGVTLQTSHTCVESQTMYVDRDIQYRVISCRVMRKSSVLRKRRFNAFFSKLLLILTYLQLKKFNSHV